MVEKDSESTVFESNPLGNRQRLVPRASFLARNAAQPAVEPVEAATSHATHDQALVSDDHTISNFALPASSAVMSPAIAIVTPLPTLASPVMLLPREINYPAVATPYFPPQGDATGGFPTLASRRMRWIAAPALALVALTVLGGAMLPAEIAPTTPVASIAATPEMPRAPRSYESANEPPAPLAIEEAAPVARPIARRVAGKRVAGKPSRKVVVDSSSALGSLRPRRAW